MNGKISTLICFSLLLAGTTFGEQRSQLKETTDSKYKVGQVWGYWTRPQEKNSSFLVLKVERHPNLRNIVHIALRGLKIRKPNGDFIETVVFVPLTEAAIDASGAKLLAEKADLPDYENSYRRWKEAFDAGQGFVYGPSVAGAVERLEASLKIKAVANIPKGEDKVLSRSNPYIHQTYHAALDRTEVRAVLGKASETFLGMSFPEPARYQSDIVLGYAHYDYEGTVPSGTRSARFTFLTKKKDTYQDPPLFTIKVEGQSIHEGEAELYLNIYEVNGNKIAEQWVTLRVPVDVLLRVASAKHVEFNIGPRSYKPEDFQQKYLGVFAKIITP